MRLTPIDAYFGNRSKKKWLAGVFLSVLLLASTVHFFRLASEDWYLHAIPSLDLAFSQWEPKRISEEDILFLDHVLSQPFEYLAEGGQSYVFGSQDGKYVLKLFKFHRFTPQSFISYLPELPGLVSIKNNHIVKREKRLRAVLNGHQIAFDFLQEESGLVFVQLKPILHGKRVAIFGKDGKMQNIDLGEVPFVLQEKGEQLSSVLVRLFERGEVSVAKEKIRQVLLLYRDEFRKGIYDKDHGVMHNIGFLGNRPIHLDVGNFVQGESNLTFYQAELQKVAQKIKNWVDDHYPHFARDIDLEIQALLKVTLL